MAIDPPSDIVLEVARAADPTRAAAVARRLNALATATPDTGADFAATLDRTGAAASAPVRGAPDMRARLANEGAVRNDKASKAQVQFEAVLLNNFVNEMLPKEAPEAFGQGLAGQMWRSLLAEKISNQIAGSGALGLGRQLFATHPLPASPASTAARTGANDPLIASGADVGGGAFRLARSSPL